MTHARGPAILARHPNNSEIEKRAEGPAFLSAEEIRAPLARNREGTRQR